jgi:lipid-A-disaccharide synthase
VTLVNIVSSTRAVPEFLGPRCQPEPIAEELLRVMDDPGVQYEAMRLTMERLGMGGEPPGLRAARAVLDRYEARTIQPPPSTRVPSGA